MCEIGTYNQELYGKPYIPISKLFDISSDKLDILLSLETLESVMSVNYDAIYAYLEEQLEGFALQLLKKILPKIILRIKKVNKPLYNDLKENLQLFEKEFCIKFDDDELANIIQIKKC